MERSTIIAGLASGMLVLVAGAGAVAAVGSLQRRKPGVAGHRPGRSRRHPSQRPRRCSHRAAHAGSASGRQGGNQNEAAEAAGGSATRSLSGSGSSRGSSSGSFFILEAQEHLPAGQPLAATRGGRHRENEK